MVTPKSRIAAGVRTCIGASLLAAGLGTRALAEPAPEYAVKAAYLYYFATFVDWPAGALGRPEDPFVIGVLGDDPFGPTLEETLRGKSIHDRTFVVKRFTRVKDALESRILFISASEQERLPSIFESLQGTTTLTIGETDGFAEQGGLIELRTEGNKVRFQINIGAADRSRLKISSQLLKLGAIVRAPGAPG